MILHILTYYFNLYITVQYVSIYYDIEYRLSCSLGTPALFYTLNSLNQDFLFVEIQKSIHIYHLCDWFYLIVKYQLKLRLCNAQLHSTRQPPIFTTDYFSLHLFSEFKCSGLLLVSKLCA